MKEFYNKAEKDHNFYWIIYFKSENIPIGDLDACQENLGSNEIEISFNIHPNYWGNGYMACAELNEDMISYDKSYGIVKEDLKDENFGYRSKKIDNRTAAYEEGPWLFKRNSLYYMLYPAGGVPEHLAYSTSKSITGPWTYGDTIMHVIKNKGAFTNHPGVIEFNVQPYLFYHDGGLPGGGGFKRSVSIEPFNFNADGSIPLIHPTKEGVAKSASNLDPFAKTEAETIAWSEGLKTAKDTKTGVYVTKINNDDYIKVRSVDFGEGAKKFEASVASNTQGGKIEIRTGSVTGTLLGTCLVKPTGGETSWTVRTCKTKKMKGLHDIYFVFKGGEGELFNFDWWSFKK